MFADSGEDHGLICEDDVTPEPDLRRVLELALTRADSWDVLRLTGLSEGKAVRARPLGDGYWLGVMMGRLKGTGAYVLNRKAALRLADALTPMWLPWDHAIDREWWFGLRTARVMPFPLSQKGAGFGSSVDDPYFGNKRAEWKRVLSTYPYQAVNETRRWVFRGASWAAIKLKR